MGKESTLDPMAAGKEMHSEPTHGHKPVDIPVDTRSAEQAVGADDPVTGMTVDQIIASGEIPDDVHELERMLGSVVVDKGAKPDPVVEKPADPVAAAAKVDEPAPAKADEAKKDDDEDAVVLARDGKNVLPYSVLKGTRNQVTTLQQKLADTEARLNAALAVKPAAGAPAEGDAAVAEMPSAAAVQLMTDEQLAELTESLPENLATVVKQQHATSQLLLKQISDLNGRAHNEDEMRKLTAAEQVQELIDKNSDLRAWQSAEDQTLWERAKTFDEALRADPEWKNRPMEQRFEQTAKLVRAMLPPEAAKPGAAPTLSLAQQAAAAVARKTAGAGAAPITHSDLPAGTPASQSEHERISALSNSQLERMFDSAKTPGEIEALLAKIA